MLARWRLLDAGQFPLARAELPDQLWQLGERDLSGALTRTIHASPSLPELAAALDVARRALPVTEAA